MKERAPQTHDLKTWPAYFQCVWDGDKTFELRKNDRDFHECDRLVLREWDPATQDYTGREVTATVDCIVKDAASWGLMDGFCIMSIHMMERSE